MKNIGKWDEFKTVERVKLSYLKNRGELLSIIKDLDWPEDPEHIEYIKKLIKKFKGAEGKEVSVLIANTLMSHVLMGTESRCLHLMEMLRSLDKTEKPYVSVCCNSHFTAVHDLATEESYRCSSCKAICEIHQPPKATIYRIKLDILEQLRDEDLGLVEMAEKMGYSNRIEAPTTVINNRPNILVVGGSKETEVEDRRLAEDYVNLPPMEKEKLLNKLKKEIVRLDAEEGSIEVVSDKSATEATPTEVPPVI
jgi:hypothetical protein